MGQPQSEQVDTDEWDPATCDFGRISSEREVLRALWGARQELVRSEIYRRMPYAERPTLGRVGQILSAFHAGGLLVRTNRKAQGHKKAGFYGLSEYGRDLCRHLGFQRGERMLFSVPEEVLRENLTRERFSLLPTTPGRIVAVYSYRGGLGQTTLVAHVTRGLAEQMSEGQSVLAIDLDLEAPGLDHLGPSEALRDCRGLGGLIVDYARVQERKRPLWLRSALRDPKYVVPIANDLTNLFYLPNGLSSGKTGLKQSERAEAMALLRAEAEAMAAAEGSRPQAPGFFTSLREAILEVFARTIVDAQKKTSLGAWIATQILADELVLCLEYDNPTEATLTGLRSVLASFLAKYKGESSAGAVLFLFRLNEHKSEEDLDQWTEGNMLVEIEGYPRISYPAEQLPYNVRLAGPYDKRNTVFYTHVVAQLNRSDPEAGKFLSPEWKALRTILDTRADSYVRSISAGLLANAPLRELVRAIEWYGAEGVFPVETDREGRELLQGVINTCLISKVVKVRPIQIGGEDR